MAEAVTVDRPPVAKPVARQRSSVSASALAQHLDCSRAYIGKLEADGVIQRQGDGFPLDASRVAYLRFLRRERRQSPRGEADADFQRAKAELIRLRIAEKQRALVRREVVDELIDTMAGTVLTHLSGMAARCTRDLAVRRAIDNVVDQVRREISAACSKMADERGEPPLDEQ
jgi:phage terminase Nu1 subunit (DNA packaging protein)